MVKSFDTQPDKTFSLTWYPVDATAGQKLYVKVSLKVTCIKVSKTDFVSYYTV